MRVFLVFGHEWNFWKVSRLTRGRGWILWLGPLTVEIGEVAYL